MAFFFRPVGAALFGRVGDRFGRRPTLILVLLLMTVSTTLIGVLPTYATIGAAAPWLLTLLRILQGLSAGGEFGGAVSVMTEFAPPGRRGLYGAWQSFTVGVGLLAGAGMAALLATVMSQGTLNDWGWRLPFLLTLPLGGVALWIRLKLDETPEFVREQHGPNGTGPSHAPDTRQPAGATVKAILLGAGRLMGWAAAGYTFLVVMPSYLQAALHASFQQALVATVVANAGFTAAILPAGRLSDRVGRRAVMLTGALLIVVLSWPLLNVLQDPDTSAVVQGVAVFVAGAAVGHAGRAGPRDAVGDVPDVRALHGTRPGLRAGERRLLRLRRADHHRAGRPHRRRRHPRLLRRRYLRGQRRRPVDTARRRPPAPAAADRRRRGDDDRMRRVIGLMSGTSFDGIDAAACDLRLDGDTLVLHPLGMVTEHYGDGLRADLATAMPPAPTTLREVCRLDTGIGQAFARAARRANEELCGGRAELAVSHGQTVYHWVDDGRVHGTLQLGEPAWIAETAALPVVSGLRTRDVAAGGHGAPLVSLVDALWLAGRPGRPVALNLGGIANVTVLGEGGLPLAFDTGPANALLDAAVTHRTGGRRGYDEDGALAACGRVDEQLLGLLLTEPYYARPAPKTTGKELFHLPYLLRALGDREVSTEDLAATLTALTALTVADAVRSVDGGEVIASGGGIRNPELMRALRTELGVAAPLCTSAELGMPSAAKEAYAFAVLGWLSVHGLPGTVPSCTGARHPSVLGCLTPGPAGFPSWEPPAATPRRLRVAA